MLTKESWLLRYLETGLKNDFIWYKKKKFYNRLIPAEGAGGKLNPLASDFTSEKISGKVREIYFNACNDQLFQILYIYFKLLNNLLYLLVKKFIKVTSAYSSNLNSWSKNNFVSVVSLWKKCILCGRFTKVVLTDMLNLTSF